MEKSSDESQKRHRAPGACTIPIRYKPWRLRRSSWWRSEPPRFVTLARVAPFVACAGALTTLSPAAAQEGVDVEAAQDVSEEQESSEEGVTDETETNGSDPSSPPAENGASSPPEGEESADDAEFAATALEASSFLASDRASRPRSRRRKPPARRWKWLSQKTSRTFPT